MAAAVYMSCMTQNFNFFIEFIRSKLSLVSPVSVMPLLTPVSVRRRRWLRCLTVRGRRCACCGCRCPPGQPRARSSSGWWQPQSAGRTSTPSAASASSRRRRECCQFLVPMWSWWSIRILVMVSLPHGMSAPFVVMVELPPWSVGHDGR